MSYVLGTSWYQRQLRVLTCVRWAVIKMTCTDVFGCLNALNIREAAQYLLKDSVYCAVCSQLSLSNRDEVKPLICDSSLSTHVLIDSADPLQYINVLFTG